MNVVTDVFVSLDAFQHRPLLVIPVISSLSVGLELLDGGGGGSAGADPVHRGRHSLAEPRLDGPYLPEDLEQHRLHALVHAAAAAALCRRLGAVGPRTLYLGGAAVSHGADGRQKEQLVDGRQQLQEHCEQTGFR